jgi:hypothetical protein
MSVRIEIRTKHLPNTNLWRNNYASLLAGLMLTLQTCIQDEAASNLGHLTVYSLFLSLIGRKKYVIIISFHIHANSSILIMLLPH